MKLLFIIFCWLLISVNANAEYLLAESGSLSAKIYTPTESWCSDDVTLNVKSKSDSEYAGSVSDLLGKMKPFLVSVCTDVKTMHITNNGEYIKDSSFKLVDGSWVAMTTHEVSALHPDFIPLPKTEVASAVSPVVNNESKAKDVKQEVATPVVKIEEIKNEVAPITPPVSSSPKVEIADLDIKKEPITPPVNNSQKVEASDLANKRNNQETKSVSEVKPVIAVAYNHNDGKFIFLSFLSVILFFVSIYVLIKSKKFNKITTARIAVISTITFSSLSALSMIIDLTHVDPMIEMAVRSLYVSILLASLYAFVSWIFSIQFMVSKLKELTSITTGYYESIYKNFMEDLSHLGLDSTKVKIYIDENTDVINAYAYTSMMGTSCVVINKPLVDQLQSDEVRAVVVHELGHIKHQDSAMMTLIMMTKDAIDRIVLAPVTLIRFAVRYFFSGVSIAFMSMNRAGVMALFIIFAISIFIIGYAGLLVVMFMLPGLIIDVFFNISAFQHSRNREFEADRTAKELGLGDSLANALIRLHNFGEAVVLPKGQARAFIGAPSNFNSYSGVNGSYSFASDSWISPTKWTKQFKPYLFMTHPNPEDRISKLREND